MKKILLITALFCISLTSNVLSQCTPDPAVVAAGDPGIFPLAPGIATGKQDSAYAQVFTVIVPADTTITPSDFIPGAPSTPMTVIVNSNTVNAVTNLPAGLTHTCATSCSSAGGTNGCFIVDGTPTQGGVFPFEVNVTLNVDIPAVFPLPAFPNQDLPAQDIDYVLIVDSAGTTSIERIPKSTFEVYPVTPNPSSTGAEIRFVTPDYRDVQLSIHNMIGAIVMSKQIFAERGMNIVSLGASDLRPGVYMVTLTDGENTSTKRMVVSSK
ncbi:MAG: T9SS type A sorting domain-containing protein [Flavobacteriales bacterium]|nr:T9SS type A sorting domain-containing protein [Flavobacteriales bacterium]MBL4735837.1 T9SS type A sorting domain-containing protein [Flavobacteriales bacterium]PCH87892.1 MAG: hypothetical protein COB88_04950 [Flavobacteriales bacterium]